MTRDEGLAQIDAAEWIAGTLGELNLHVATSDDQDVHAWITVRPPYCDRGHYALQIDGPINLDAADSFPRYFFGLAEALTHTRAFLRWRLWKERSNVA